MEFIPRGMLIMCYKYESNHEVHYLGRWDYCRKSLDAEVSSKQFIWEAVCVCSGLYLPVSVSFESDHGTHYVGNHDLWA